MPASENWCLSRYTVDLLELLKTNYSISSACFSYPPTAAQLLRGESGCPLEELKVRTTGGAEGSWFTSGQCERVAGPMFIMAKALEKVSSLKDPEDHNET